MLCLHLQRWLIKLEDEAAATGAAVLDAADAWRQLAAARRAAAAADSSAASTPRSAGAAERPPPVPAPVSAAAGTAEEERLAAVQRLAALLLRGLRGALRVLAPSAYPSYRAFVQVRRSSAHTPLP